MPPATPSNPPQEDDKGRLWPIESFTRSVDEVVVAEQTPHFQRALRLLLGRINQVPWQTATLPESVFRAQTMTLKWHGEGDKLECQEVLHASDNYYQRGPWYDSVRAWHRVPTTGPARRLPEERSRCGEVSEPAEAPGFAYVQDVARILGLYFCVVPDGTHKGDVVPFLYVLWMQFHDCFPSIQVPSGEGASVLRCRDVLEEWGMECVRDDPHELPYMLVPDEVECMVYLQNGYHTPRAGSPDFYIIDTVWDKL